MIIIPNLSSENHITLFLDIERKYFNNEFYLIIGTFTLSTSGCPVSSTDLPLAVPKNTVRVFPRLSISRNNVKKFKAASPRTKTRRSWP